MKGGSLEDRLFLSDSARRQLSMLPGPHDDVLLPSLTWQQLLGVALGCLRGLEYLHGSEPETHKPVILHGDIKPSNVLLDSQLNARLADMGLAQQQRPMSSHLTTMTAVAGTHGYVDPHYAERQQAGSMSLQTEMQWA